MLYNEYKITVHRLINSILDIDNIFKSAIQQEFAQNMNRVSLDGIIDCLKKYQDVIVDNKLYGKKVAIIYNGNPEITIQILLMALKNNMNIKLVSFSYNIINNCLFSLYLEIMKDLKINNTFLDYDEMYSESDIIKEKDDFDKIVYIGNYYDYKNFKYFASAENLAFWNNNNVKVLMSREDSKEEYKNIVKYAYANNLELEVYDFKSEFLKEVNEGEFAVIYTDEDEKEFLDIIKPRIIRFNEFNIDDFKFKINDFILDIDFY